jgi:SAM-dependent methyltransferase
MKKVLFLVLSCFSGWVEASDIREQYDPLNTARAYSKGDYDETYFLIRRCLEKYFADWPVEKMSKARVLDYGCGTGRSSRLLNSFGFDHVLGIDPSSSMVELARKSDSSGEFAVISSDFDWNGLEGKFDVISSSLVLPVLSTKEEIVLYLQNAHSALKDNGIVVIVACSIEAFDPKCAWLSWDQDFPENYSATNGDTVAFHLKKADLLLHDSLWTREFLEKIFEDQSFKIEHLFKPLGHTDDPFFWQSELSVAPFDIYILRKCAYSEGS